MSKELKKTKDIKETEVNNTSSKEKWYKIKEVKIAILLSILFFVIGFGFKCAYNYNKGIAPISPYYKELNSEYLGTEVIMSNIGYDISNIELKTLSMKSDDININGSKNGYYISLDEETIKFIKELPTEYIESNSEEKLTDDYLGETIDIYDYCVLSYTYKNSDKTFVMSKNDLDMIDITNVKEIDKNMYEDNQNNKQITTYYKDKGIRLYSLELITGDGELVNTSNTYKIKGLRDKIKYTSADDVEQEKVKVVLDGLGELKAEEIDCLNEAPGLYYTTFDGIMRLYNYKDELPYAFITNVDNYYFLCNSDDLEKTNKIGLYKVKGWDNPESANYRTVGLQRKDEKGIYIIRVASEAPDTTLEMILNQFNYSVDDLK